MNAQMSGDDRPTMPPVRLLSDAELARDALAAPLFARAVKLAGWAGTGVRVGVGGGLLPVQIKEAVEELGLSDDEDGTAHATAAWDLALETGLIDFEEDEEEEEEGDEGEGARAAGSGTEAGREPGTGAGSGTGAGDAGGEQPVAGIPLPSGVARGGEELARLTDPEPSEVLELWQDGLESVLFDAATPSFEDLLGDLQASVEREEGDTEPGAIDPASLDPESIDLDSMDWDPDEEADFLDSALGNLYLLTATDHAVSAGAMVPLPVLAASMIVPEDMDEPTDAVLEEVSAAMMKLDDQFRLLEPAGLVEYRPVDEALTEEAEEDSELPEELDEEDVSRYGMVRLTPLGVYGVRARIRDAGIDAPAVGDLAGAEAGVLLGALPSYTEENARAEIESWLSSRTPLEAARELLAAAHGTDESGPARRLACQQALSLSGEAAEPALREVLEDRELGGLARVWLAEHGARDVPQPDEEMVFWLTVDTLAAQLDTVGEATELQGLVQGLVDQHAGFFDKAWRVDHPATAEVLDAMGRVHPDKRTAKEARKAAFKARSRTP
jgi:hypothetical protein